MTENQIKARILMTGRALERADWTNMNARAAWKWCELHARMGGCHDPADLEKIVTGAMVFVMEGGSSGHPGAEFDEAEIEAEPSDANHWIERENAPLVKPQPVGVKLDGYNV